MLKKKTEITRLFVALAGATGFNVASAAENGVYLGLNVGQAEARKYCDNIANCDSADDSWRGEVGYQFNQSLSAELGYTSFGTLFTANNSSVNASQDANAWTVSALALWPGLSPVGIFGRLGITRYSVSSSGTIQGVPVEENDRTKPYYGVGAQFDLTVNWMLRAEYQIYTNISGVDGREDNVHAWYAGGAYRF